jgi:hypothetical protein
MRKPFSSNTTFGDQMPLGISPEPYKAIDASALGIDEFAFATVYQTIHTPVGRNISVPSPGIRVNNRTTLCPLVDQAQESCRLYTSNYLSLYIAMTAQDTKHRLFACPAISLSPLQS